MGKETMGRSSLDLVMVEAHCRQIADGSACEISGKVEYDSNA